MNPYEVLGVAKDATAEEIGVAYRQLAGIYHPDKNPNNPRAAALFKEVNDAYLLLRDEDKRRAFDRFGEQGDPRVRTGTAPQPPGLVEDVLSALGFAHEMSKPAGVARDQRRIVEGAFAAGRVAGVVSDLLIGPDTKQAQPPPPAAPSTGRARR
jgi:curved DNA-binding protein CbpA